MTHDGVVLYVLLLLLLLLLLFYSFPFPYRLFHSTNILFEIGRASCKERV